MGLLRQAPTPSRTACRLRDRAPRKADVIAGVVISDSGTGAFLIRKSDLTKSDLNTGWTINIIMKSLAGLCIFFSSEVISNYMGDDRLHAVLQVLCIASFLSGFNNTGMVLFDREYNYKPKFIINLFKVFFFKNLIKFFLNLNLIT